MQFKWFFWSTCFVMCWVDNWFWYCDFLKITVFLGDIWLNLRWELKEYVKLLQIHSKFGHKLIFTLREFKGWLVKGTERLSIRDIFYKLYENRNERKKIMLFFTSLLSFFLWIFLVGKRNLKISFWSSNFPHKIFKHFTYQS